jgi:hypothetical protein
MAGALWRATTLRAEADTRRETDVKLEEWRNFYNYQCPHDALGGKTPCESLWEKTKLECSSGVGRMTPPVNRGDR